jgi:hypothetical protein
MLALRPCGTHGLSNVDVITAIAANESQAATEIVALVNRLMGTATIGFLAAAGPAGCTITGKNFDFLHAQFGPAYPGPPADWGEAAIRLIEVTSRAGAGTTGAGTAGAGTTGAGSAGVGGQSSGGAAHIAHRPMKGTTTRTTKASASSTTSIGSAVGEPLTFESTIVAEGLATREPDEIDECARLSGAPGYGEAAGAVMSSDGTFNGPMGEKCDPQQLEPGIRQGKGGRRGRGG